MNRVSARGRQHRIILADGLGIVVTALLLLNPTSGFKNVLVWAALLYCLVRAIRQHRSLQVGGIGTGIAAWVGVCLVAALLSIDRAFSMSQWAKLIELAAGFVVLATLLSTPKAVDRAIGGFVYAAGALALLDVGRLAAGLLSGHDVLVEGRWFNSLLGYPTIAAGTYAVALLLGWSRLLQPGRQRKTRVYLGLSVVAGLVMLYMLQTRSVLLGLAIGILVMALLSPLRRYARALGVVVVALAAVAMLLIPGHFRERLLAGTTSGRTSLWQDAGALMRASSMEAPYRTWIGVGYGHRIFERLHAAMPPDARAADRVYDHTHNMFVETRVQVGFLGMAVWMGLLLVVGVRLIQRFPSCQDRLRRQSAASVAGAMALLLVYGQFSLFFGFLPALLFWTLLAVLLSDGTLRKTAD